MGYTTTFDGCFRTDKPMTATHRAYLKQFSETRRMRRNPDMTCRRPDPLREAAGLPVGPQGAYFVGEGGFAGQDAGPDVADHNNPPSGQPSLWCQWVPGENDDDDTISWDEGEKFYNSQEWIEYLIEHFLAPWGYTLNGVVRWAGEDYGDIGAIVVKDNVVSTVEIDIERLLPKATH